MLFGCKGHRNVYSTNSLVPLPCVLVLRCTYVFVFEYTSSYSSGETFFCFCDDYAAAIILLCYYSCCAAVLQNAWYVLVPHPLIPPAYLHPPRPPLFFPLLYLYCRHGASPSFLSRTGLLSAGNTRGYRCSRPPAPAAAAAAAAATTAVAARSAMRRYRTEKIVPAVSPPAASAGANPVPETLTLTLTLALAL